MRYDATYSPEDDKLRIYASSRLDDETYQRIKAAGFRWAPKQDLFFAVWSPDREDVLTELAGEIEDEDKSLVERAEERADRFDTYSANRLQDAERAREAVSAIADHIPFGQPILVGHHSEKRARKDAERIRSGMDKAVKMWRTSEYWQQRAAGALAHAKYKERPAVRARRIKTLEAELRKVQRGKAESEKWLRAWSLPGLTLEQAISIANLCWLTLPRKEGDRPDFNQRPCAHDALTNSSPTLYAPRTLQEVIDYAKAAYPPSIERANRWIEHLSNRIAYERAMLAEAGGIATDQTKPQKGGACRCWASPRGGWSYIQKVNQVSVTVLDNWGNGGGNFTRTIPFDKLQGVMTAAQVQEARNQGRLAESGDGRGFFLTTTQDAPAPEPAAATPKENPGQEFEAMAQSLKAGIKVAAVNQLFPTPRDLADRMILEADIQAGHRVLEPSAGTGHLLDALPDVVPLLITAVEINRQLIDTWKHDVEAHCCDFLEQTPEQLGSFDRIVMNPPFENGADIRHILHARQFLKPGGRLVAICANGPRQRDQLLPIVEQTGGFWEDLPDGTFKEQGTGVRTVLLTMHGPELVKADHRPATTQTTLF